MLGGFTREIAKEVVTRALKAVGDYHGDDIEVVSFNRLFPFAKEVFLRALKREVNSIRLDGRTYFDVPLNEGLFKIWRTVGDCINWVYENAIPREKS